MGELPGLDDDGMTVSANMVGMVALTVVGKTITTSDPA
jgi:hypothetical protein